LADARIKASLALEEAVRQIATAAALLGGLWLAPAPQTHEQFTPQGNPMVGAADFKLASLLLLPCGAQLAARDSIIGILQSNTSL